MELGCQRTKSVKRAEQYRKQGGVKKLGEKGTFKGERPRRVKR